MEPAAPVELPEPCMSVLWPELPVDPVPLVLLPVELPVPCVSGVL